MSNYFDQVEEDYYCLIKCSCDRKFKSEEMYICYVCNQLRCKYCVRTEYEYYQCKNNCKPSNILEEKNKDNKNCCDTCLECPICFTCLVKREVNSIFLLFCPSCNWNSKDINILRNNEKEFDGLIVNLNKEYCNNYLRRMYVFIQENLYKDPIFTQRPEKSFEYKSLTMEEKNPYDEIVRKAMNENDWKLEQLQEQLEKDKKANEEHYNSKFTYTDDYYLNPDRKYMSFQLVSKLLSSLSDYSEKIDSLEELQKALSTEYNVNLLTSLEQRHKNVIFQNPFRNAQFPKFVDLVPRKAKSSKKCNSCGKILVEAGESINKSANIRFQVLHSFINQFPSITIYKLDLALNVIVLKFSMYVNKEVSISFKEEPESEMKVDLPKNKYSFKDIEESDGTKENDEFLYSKKNKAIILNFRIKQESQSALANGTIHIFKFIIIAEYTKEDFTTSTIEYSNEIKFKVETK